jgi:phage-related baseplate assembly protein
LSSIDKLNNLADIDFVDMDVDSLLADLIADYQSEYAKETGEAKTLAGGDPVRILLYANAARIYAILQSINHAAKQNLLKYAAGDYLDQIGARVGATRLSAGAATATARFSLSAVQTGAVTIPAGIRAAAGNVYFATTTPAEVRTGNLYTDVTVECAETGASGNGFTSGQINVLVDPIQYVAGVSNIDTSQGGSDAEDDDSFRERIFLKPESFSVAGPSGAYEYFAKEYSSGILDVAVNSPADGEVDIYIILEDGVIPGEAVLSGLGKYLSADTRRPLTDKVTVQAPTQVSYDIALTYYIKASDGALETSIKIAVTNAITAYVLWQKSKIGRDIDPGYLQYLIYAAGAKRVVIDTPIFKQLTNTQVAAEGTITANYGGLEDE